MNGYFFQKVRVLQKLKGVGIVSENAQVDLTVSLERGDEVPDLVRCLTVKTLIYGEQNLN